MDTNTAVSKKIRLSTPVIAAALLVLVGVGGAGIVSAATATTSTGTATHAHMGGGGVRGTVASVSGSIITVTGKNGTTYTVDATSAKFTKSASGAKPAAATISDIAVGDTVAVRGTVSGDSVTATSVRDGAFAGRGGKGRGVAGTVSAVNGNTVTITNSKGVSYTVDATNSKVSEIVSLPLSGIKVGDKVGVQGTVSGDSVTATHITDNLTATAPTTSTQ